MKELLSIEDPIAGLLGAWSAGLNLKTACRESYEPFENNKYASTFFV